MTTTPDGLPPRSVAALTDDEDWDSETVDPTAEPIDVDWGLPLASTSASTPPASTPAPAPAPASPAPTPAAAPAPTPYDDLLLGLEEEGTERPVLTIKEEMEAVASQVKAARDAGNMTLARVMASDLKQLIAEQQNETLLRTLIADAKADMAELHALSTLTPEQVALRDTIAQVLLNAHERSALSGAYNALGELLSLVKKNEMDSPEILALEKRNEERNTARLGQARTMNPYPRGFEKPEKLFKFEGSPASKKARATQAGKSRSKVWSRKGAERLFQFNQTPGVMPDGEPIIPIVPEKAITLAQIWARVDQSQVLTGGPGGKYGSDLEAGVPFDRVMKFTNGEHANSAKLEARWAEVGWILAPAPGTGSYATPETTLWYVKPKGFLTTK